MKNLRKNIFYTFFLLLLTFCFLFHAKKTAQFAYVGLHTWFEQMIISLFPFMVLMNVLLRTGLSNLFIQPFYKLLRPIFRNCCDAIFVIFFGFLCGFPLGCKCAVDLYKKGRLSKENAQYLLCFTNNIGPAYMLGFFIEKIKPTSSVYVALFCLYGIPLLYGMLLRYTVYKKSLDYEYAMAKTTFPVCDFETPLIALPGAIFDSLTQIATLGGYMILFNAFRIVPHLFFKDISWLYIATQSVLEISGGLLCVNCISADNIAKTVLLYAVFSFQGFCCHFQTFSVMQNTPLSRKKYMLHKMILCSITILSVWLIHN